MAKHPPVSVTASRERTAWNMMAEGKSQAVISAALGVDPSTVSRMIKRVNQRLAKEFTENALEIKVQQTAQLEYIAAEAMRVWEESEGDVATVRQSVQREPVKGSDGKPKMLYGPHGELVISEDGQPVMEQIVVSVTETRETRHQLPDPRCLAEVRGALSDIRKIWGLDAERGGSALAGGALVGTAAYIVFSAEGLQVGSVQEDRQSQGA